MKLGSAQAWARTLGAGLAHIQNGVDHVIEYGFGKLKDLDTTPKKHNQPANRLVRGVFSVLGGTAKFIGMLGDSYFKAYEELKRKK